MRTVIDLEEKMMQISINFNNLNYFLKKKHLVFMKIAILIVQSLLWQVEVKLNKNLFNLIETA
jgi:hypothetical protein